MNINAVTWFRHRVSKCLAFILIREPRLIVNSCSDNNSHQGATTSKAILQSMGNQFSSVGLQNQKHLMRYNALDLK